MYAVPMLMTETRAQWSRIEAAETVALRAMFRRNDNYAGLLERAQVQPVHEEYSNLSSKFATRLDQPGYAELLVTLDTDENQYPSSLSIAMRGLTADFKEKVETLKTLAEFRKFIRENEN